MLCYAPLPADTPMQYEPAGTPVTGSSTRSPSTLFQVTSELTGPWRVGALTTDESGRWTIVAPDAETASPGTMQRPMRATFTVFDKWPNRSLPSLSNGVIAESDQQLRVAPNSDSLLFSSSPRWPVTYTIESVRLPTVAELQKGVITATNDMAPYFERPAIPTHVGQALGQFQQGSAWDRFDGWRNWVLDNVESINLGRVVPTPANDLDDMVRRLEATPFGLVALQVIGARWLGVPARIAFGFDGGDRTPVENTRVVAEKNAITYVEIHFDDLGWVPVVGTPRRADGDRCS